jgi:hypothetical protein
MIHLIHLLTAIGLTPGGSSTEHIYTQTIHRTTQNKKYIEQRKFWKSAGRAHPCEFFFKYFKRHLYKFHPASGQDNPEGE